MTADELEICRKSAKVLNILNADGTDLQIGGTQRDPYYLVDRQYRVPTAWNPLRDLDQRWECEKYLNEHGWLLQTLPGSNSTHLASQVTHGAQAFRCSLLEFPARVVAAIADR